MSLLSLVLNIYRFKRLVMGASPASEEFHEKLRKAVGDLQGHIQIKDDIIVYGHSQSDHDKNLKSMLQRLSDKGFTLRKDKCEWNQTQVLYFGYVFSEKGMSADPVKVQAIINTPSPKSISEVKSFIQMCQYNSFFMCQSGETFSDMTSPLRRLLHKGQKFTWTQECERAVQKLKTALTSETVMGAFSAEHETQLVVDRGPEGIAATVMQKDPDTSQWRPINYTSRAKTPTERNYSPIEGESLAIMSGILSNRMYLYGIPFTAVTDHKPLVSLYNNPKRLGPARVDNHRLKVQGFDFTVKHEPGHSNPCDYNSRHPPPPREYTPQEKEELGIEDGTEFYINAIISNALPDPITFDILRKETNKDDTLAMLKADVLRGKLSKRPAVQPFKEIFSELSIVKSLVMRGTRIVIPRELQQDIIALAHEGHQGLTKTKQYLRSRVWFPGMDRKTTEYIETCRPCQAANSRCNPQPLKPSQMPDRPWQKLAMDFKGPIASDYYFFLLIDEYSRFPEVEIVKSTAAETLIPKLHKILCTHGIPEVIKSDNGPPFNGEKIKEYARRQGFQHRRIEPEHPESNGLAENFMRMLTKVAHTAYVEGQDPKQAVNNFLLNYRATPHSILKVSPSEILFGRKIHTKVPILHSTRQSKLHRMLRKLDKESKEKAQTLFNRRKQAQPTSIQIGDLVLLRQKKTSTKPSFDPKPFTVIEKKGSMITARRGTLIRTRDASKWRHLRINFRTHYKPEQTRRKEGLAGQFEDAGGSSEDDLMYMQQDNCLETPEEENLETPEEENLETPEEENLETIEEENLEPEQGLPRNEELIAGHRYPSRNRRPPHYLKDYVP